MKHFHGPQRNKKEIKAKDENGKMGGSWTKAVEFGRAKSSNIQAPSTREASNPKLQTRRSAPLELGSWSFSGVWVLGLGPLDPEDMCPHVLSARSQPDNL